MSLHKLFSCLNFVSCRVHAFEDTHLLFSFCRLLSKALHWNTCMFLQNIRTILGNFIPVHNIPPIAHILGSAVLVLQVVRMLPNIQTKDRKLDLIFDTLHQRIILIGCTWLKNRKQIEETRGSKQDVRNLKRRPIQISKQHNKKRAVLIKTDNLFVFIISFFLKIKKKSKK